MRRRHALALERREGREHLVVVRPGAHHQHDPGDARTPATTASSDDLRDERGRQVVDDEPAEVLEDVGRLRPPRPRQPGDHDELVHRASLPAIPRARAPSGPRGDQPDLAVTSTSSRGTVAASAYSGARARKPGGGAGSIICSSTSPASASALT